MSRWWLCSKCRKIQVQIEARGSKYIGGIPSRKQRELRDHLTYDQGAQNYGPIQIQPPAYFVNKVY